jgi:hypothetical protein
MGVIRSGILSRVSGKVAGVVGGSWKDKAYLREYVIPANPNTVPQQIQRIKMAQVVAFGKALVGQVFNVYTDKFERGMSGFNRFVKDNIGFMGAPITFASVKLTSGKLWGVVAQTAELSAGVVDIAWDAALVGNNGAATDHIYAAIYSEVTDLWYFPAAEVHRSTSSLSVTCAGEVSAPDLKLYLWAAQYSPTSASLLQMISNSAYKQVTA